MECNTRLVILLVVGVGVALGEDEGMLGNGSGSDSSGDNDGIIGECTGSSVCRLSVLSGVVLCVVGGLFLVIRGSRKSTETDETASSVPSELNKEDAHAVSHYQPHETLWPGPNAWRKHSLHNRGKITAKVVRQTTSILKGPEAPEHAKQLNNWVRSDDGIYRDDLEPVKHSLDELLCTLDPSQENYSTELGPPWPRHNRWRRASNRLKAMVYAEYMKTRLTQKTHVRRYAKWVKERGYLINRVFGKKQKIRTHVPKKKVDLAQSEAEITINNVLGDRPVAYSDAKDAGGFLSTVIEAEDGVGVGTLQEEEEDDLVKEGLGERAPLLGGKVPELSITVASLTDDQRGGGCGVVREDSLAVFNEYLGTSPRLCEDDVLPPQSPSPPPPPRRPSLASPTTDPSRLSLSNLGSSDSFGLNDDCPPIGGPR